MRTKLDLLRINEPLYTLDFYVIVETSLNSNFLSSELGFPRLRSIDVIVTIQILALT